MRRSLRQMTKKNTSELCFRNSLKKKKGMTFYEQKFSIHDEITFGHWIQIHDLA